MPSSRPPRACLAAAAAAAVGASILWSVPACAHWRLVSRRRGQHCYQTPDRWLLCCISAHGCAVFAGKAPKRLYWPLTDHQNFTSLLQEFVAGHGTSCYLSLVQTQPCTCERCALVGAGSGAVSGAAEPRKHIQCEPDYHEATDATEPERSLGSALAPCPPHYCGKFTGSHSGARCSQPRGAGFCATSVGGA